MQLSTDGLIRLSFDELLSLPITHLVSGVDVEEALSTEACGRPTTISGYTEWVSQTQPAISIGWDWCLQPSALEGRCQRVGLPRTNVMLVDEGGTDKPWTQNLECVGSVVDVLPWTEIVPRRLTA